MLRLIVMQTSLLLICTRSHLGSAFTASHKVARLSRRTLHYSSPDAAGARTSNAVMDSSLIDKTQSSTNNTTAAATTTTTVLDLDPPRGTRDFAPPDMRLRNWLFGHWRRVAADYAFSEYDAPVLEQEALYVRKAGEEVTQQLYNFVDKGGRRVALRPEMTPSLARLVLKQKNGLSLPLKWFAIPQCWRYERMTRGRRREHYQWNMDVWGVAGVTAEAELLKAMVSFFERVGLTSKDVGIKVNSRVLIGEILTRLNVPADKFAATCVLIDKLEKMPVEALEKDLCELGLDPAGVQDLLALLQNKSIESLQAAIGADSVGLQDLKKFLELCKAYNIADWIVLDASVVRGLAYYTGIVFEAFDRQGKLRAIAGGGRYDKLLETFGGEPTPAVGFGFGDAVIVEMLQDKGLLPDTSKSEMDVVVCSMSSDLYGVALQVASSIREGGQQVDMVLEDKKLKWVFKHANRLGAKYCVVVGADEYAKGGVAVKNLEASEQETVPIDGLRDWFASRNKKSV
jgi:histidyl-tRNA synthetase